jgi:hypothetical protein
MRRYWTVRQMGDLPACRAGLRQTHLAIGQQTSHLRKLCCVGGELGKSGSHVGGAHIGVQPPGHAARALQPEHASIPHLTGHGYAQPVQLRHQCGQRPHRRGQVLISYLTELTCRGSQVGDHRGGSSQHNLERGVGSVPAVRLAELGSHGTPSGDSAD